ncbi:MAG: acyltransferase [Clostridia bacterium]|nr:acyltransferase [Clostridia bacterium]
MESAKRNDRIIGFDILKTIAVIFVLILHINSYCMETTGMDNDPVISYVPYLILEGLAIPAVDIFVLIGSYLMLGKSGVRISNLLKVYFSALFVGLIGLAAAAAVTDIGSVSAVLSCVFPFAFKGFWYVSIYLLLMLLSPFLNMLIEKLDNRRLIYVTAIILTVVVLLPTFVPKQIFSFANWGESRLPLFICLYFIAACIKRFELHKKSIITGFAIWGSSTLILILLSVIWGIAAKKWGGVFVQSFDLLYDYSSLLVVLEAVGLFLIFCRIKDGSNAVKKISSKIAGCSLIIYIYHMHPIIKNMYVKWNIFEWVNTDSGIIYIFEVFGVALAVLAAGVIVGIALNKIVSLVSKAVIKLINKHEKALKFLEKIGLLCN